MDLSRLTLDESCLLLGGATTWRTHAIEAQGVPAVKMSDGPNGARGESTGATGVPGVVVPVGIALGATWDPELVERIGDLLGTEAQRRGAHVLLAPTVNIIRTPIGGRVFECYSEDPELTARLAVGFVRGVQSHDVAVTVKHFVANDTEIQRLDVDVHMAEAVLREVYLRPFEAAVLEAGAWGIMSAYNRLDGEFCAHHRRLLHDILRDEWGFDGFVVSDWGGAHDTVAAGRAGLTVAMPGPNTIFGPRLADAVRAGAVEEEHVTARVAELGRLIDRTHAARLSADRPQESVDDPDERALCRTAAVSSMVLLRNRDGALPLGDNRRIAVIGPNAARTRIMGGGSSSLRALPHRSILDALTDRLGEAVVSHSRGAAIDKVLPPFTGAALRTPDGQEGLLVEFRNGSDPASPVVATAISSSSAYTSFGSTPAGVTGDGEFLVTLVGEVIPEEDGPHLVGALVTGKSKVTIGDTVVVDDPDRSLPRGDWLFGYGSEEQTAVVDLRAGEAVPVSISTTGIHAFTAVSFGARPADPPPLIDEAVAAARAANVAVVVVGTTDEWETEGVDRTTIVLPGDQDELVRRVAAVSPRTIVVVNAGGPVAMPWLDDVDAVLTASFAGEETGPAVAAVLAGDADPGGRLPVTYPRRLEDSPAWPHYRPVDGVQTYGEGRLVGYRGHEAAGVEPLFAFGHGLSYGTSEWSDFALSAPEIPGDGSLRVSVVLTSTGDRPVTDVVQVYVTHPHPDMAPKTLAGFAKRRLAPGETVVVEVELGPVAWRRWDEGGSGWVVDAGEREVIVAASAGDERARLPLRISG